MFCWHSITAFKPYQIAQNRSLAVYKEQLIMWLHYFYTLKKQFKKQNIFSKYISI